MKTPTGVGSRFTSLLMLVALVGFGGISSFRDWVEA